jgi:hypothetical protein
MSVKFEELKEYMQVALDKLEVGEIDRNIEFENDTQNTIARKIVMSIMDILYEINIKDCNYQTHISMLDVDVPIIKIKKTSKINRGVKFDFNDDVIFEIKKLVNREIRKNKQSKYYFGKNKEKR